MSPDQNDRYLFVYGTLRAGAQNAIDRLKPAPDYIGKASLAGILYDFGPYPGLLLAEVITARSSELKSMTANRVPQAIQGEVWRISASLEKVLDEIEAAFPSEADEFLKHYCEIPIAGTNQRCLVYVINPVYLKGKPIIESGDWLKHRQMTN